MGGFIIVIMASRPRVSPFFCCVWCVQEKLQDEAAGRKRVEEAEARQRQRTVELAAELADEKARVCVHAWIFIYMCVVLSCFL